MIMKKTAFISSFIGQSQTRIVGFMATINRELFEIFVDKNGEVHIWINGKKSSLQLQDLEDRKSKSIPFKHFISIFHRYKEQCQQYALTGEHSLYWEIYHAHDKDEAIKAGLNV
jgi:hypothetical protein